MITRESARPEDLVRLVLAPDATVQVDYRARLDGRGAWITPRRDVVAAAEARPAVLARAFDVERCDASGLLDRVRAANLHVVLELLSLSSRAGALASGADQVESACGGPLLGFVIANDASARTVEGLGRPELERWELPLDRVALGQRIGKGPRAIIALRPAAPTRALADQLRRRQELR